MQPADIFPLDLALVPIRLLNADSITWRLNPPSLHPLFDVTTLWSKHYCGQCQTCVPYVDRHDFTQPSATGNTKKNFLRCAGLVTNLLVPMSLNTGWRRYLSTGKRISTDVQGASKILEQASRVSYIKQKKKTTHTNICPKMSDFCV
jgi:hypothetical protein